MPPFFIRFKTRSRQKRGIYKSFPKTDKSKNHRNAEKKPDEQSRKRGKYQKVQKYFEPFFQSAAVHNGVAGKKARQSENQPRHAADNRRSVAYSAASSPKAAPKPKNSSGPKMNRYSYQLICLKTSKVTFPSIRFIPVM